jgi:hypothetical protein
MKKEDLQGQRAALTEDCDEGSGGESGGDSAVQSPEAATAKVTKKQRTLLQDSMKPCMMITALLATFALLAFIVLYVVNAAFEPEQHALLTNAAGAPPPGSHSST